MRIAALAGIAVVSTGLAALLAIRRWDGPAISIIIQTLTPALLALSSVGAIAIHGGSKSLRKRAIRFTVLAGVYVAVLGLTHLGLHTWLLVRGSKPGYDNLFLGAFYVLAAGFVLAGLDLKIKLVTRPYR